MKNPGDWVPGTSLLRIARIAGTAVLVLATATSAMQAQDPAPMTLHVYTNLIQVPTLVVTPDLQQFPTVKREQFAISLDGGPHFKPTQMRIEGDDPISLTVLLDASGDADDLVKPFGEALAKLVPRYLKPRDHVSIYAMDCGLIRSLTDLPADAGMLKAGVASALAAPGLHGTGQRGNCANSLRLWDVILKLSENLGDLPGRRVLLVVSAGKDSKSVTAWDQVVSYAGSKSVAIFGLRDWDLLHVNGKSVDRFDQMCENNGGFVQTAAPRELVDSLQNLVTMLRGRYILEFPRPDEGLPGSHSISITVRGTSDLALTTGVTYATPDPSVLDDPNTVHTSPSPATFGHKR